MSTRLKQTEFAYHQTASHRQPGRANDDHNRMYLAVSYGYSLTGCYRRSARVPVSVVIAVVALIVGVVGGYGLSKRLGTGGPSSSSANSSEGTSTDDELWYTCGMHPNVLQKGPGDCPICQMKLTPLKKDEVSSDSGGSKERKVLYWRAPMDPNYISEKPGKSPMGMDLVPVYADAEESKSSHTIRIDPVTIQNMGIRTAVVKRGPLVKTIRTVGRIDYNEQLVTFIDTKFNGWIEKLYANETGQHVEKDERLFDVYSPELYAAQEEYLAAVRNLPLLEKSTFAPAREEAVKMVEAAVTKLEYLDVSNEQIEILQETGKVEKTLTIHSPSTGIVTEKMVLEGMYVKPGMRLYTIADLSRIWVYVDVYEYQLPWVRTGQLATMTLPYIAGKKFIGKVVYIYPYLEERTRVIKVRLEFENANLELKPGMYANIRLESELQRDAILVPREAYIDSGTRQVVFVVRGNGKFAPRDIQVGIEAENSMVEVLFGLDEGEVVVTSGQFMLDAESKLKEAVAKMMEAEQTKTTKRSSSPDTKMLHDHDHDMAGEHAAMMMPPDATYACPMEKHPDEKDLADRGPYFANEPGSCPRCGMKLKPIDEFSWVDQYKEGADRGMQMPGGSQDVIPADARFACPMEAHPDESNPADQGPYFANEEGKCPRCGMKVKPLDQLDWIRMRRAAQGGDVAYTCPDHQHIFSEESGECPRCGKSLMPFKVMYTCSDPDHANTVSVTSGNCPHDGSGMAAFRGIWLDETMASENVPASPGLAEIAPYHCPVHPLVHSDEPGYCTICGAELESSSHATDATVATKTIPAGAKYTCMMKECWHFSTKPGECPVCGMRLKPIDQVGWTKELLKQQLHKMGSGYVCPMHSEQVRSSKSGTCSICGMQLVKESAIKRPKAPPEQLAVQIGYIMEHYLEVQRSLATDRTKDLTLHALGLVSSSEELSTHLDNPGINLPSEAKVAAKNLRTAALKITGKLEADRVTFVEISAAVRELVAQLRPDRARWPKLYLYHCPMSKGDWFQTVKDKANPYYGFKMLKCGELIEIK